MSNKLKGLGAFALSFLGLTLPVQAGDWVKYKAPGYGFSMEIPKGTHLKEKVWDHGWAGLYAEHDGVELWAITQQCYQATDKEFSDFGVSITHIAAEHWEKVDEGKKTHGWHWYKVYLACHGDDAVFGGYGVGPRGSYLLLLKTTLSDYKKHEKEYEHWYESIKLHDDWFTYHSKEYKFSMLLPKGTKATNFHDEDLGDGVHAKHGNIELWGLAEHGNQSKVEEFEHVRDLITEVPGKHWKEVDKGKSYHGFNWYKCTKVSHGDTLVFALYGCNKVGSFLLLLKTSKSDYEADSKNYDLWYRSIRGD